MRLLGIEQWDESYPPADVFYCDCFDRNLFVLKGTQGQIVGCATLDNGAPEVYASID